MLLQLTVLLICTFTCNGLLSLWAATSKRHWFIRTAVVLAAQSLLLFVPAYEPLIALAAQSATVVLGVQARRIWRYRKHRTTTDQPSSQKSRPSFGLASLLLLTTVCAYLAAVGAKLPALELGVEDWLNVALIGFTAGLWTLLGAVSLTFSGWRFALFALLSLTLAIVLAAPLALLDGLGVSFIETYSRWPLYVTTRTLLGITIERSQVVWFATGGAVALLVWLLLVLWSAIVNSQGRLARRVGLSAVGLAAVALLLLSPMDAYLALAFPLPIPQQNLPSPNGYDLLVTAGKQLEKAQVNIANYDPATATDRQMARVAAEVAAPVAEARLALKLPTVVPVLYGSIELDFEQANSLRSVARALAALGHHAERAGRVEEAMAAYLDLLDLGNAAGNHGLIVNALVGYAITDIGCHTLYELQAQLTGEQRLSAIKRIANTIDKLEPIAGPIHRDRIWMQHVFGWDGRLSQWLLDQAKEETAVDAYVGAHARTRLQLQLLAAKLAIESYREEHGELPPTLDATVLGDAGIPLTDPFSPDDALLHYLPSEDGTFLLYSVGHNGIDDHGYFQLDDNYYSYSALEGDITLELLFEHDRLEAEAAAAEQAMKKAAEMEDLKLESGAENQ